MKKTLILASVSLLCLSSVFSSDRTDRAQFGVPSQGITPSAGVEPHDNTAQPSNNPSVQLNLPGMPPEILGKIANNLEAEDVIILQSMTGDRTLQAKTHTPGFYQQNNRVMTFDIGNPKIFKSLIRYLQKAPQGANIELNIKLKLIGVTLDNLKQILPYCNEVTALDLRNNQIGDDGARALAESETLDKLTSLDLSSNQISSVGAQALAESQILIKLTSLDLGSNQIGDDGAQAIKNRYPFAMVFW